MTSPQKNESKDAFLHRFMADADARREYANEQERFERGAQLWDARGALEAANSFGYNAERDGAELFPGRHLQPGVVNYPEMKNPVTGAQGIALLIEKSTIDAMRPSAEGVPVINWKHDMSGGSERWIQDGKAVGVMVASRWDGDDAWEHCSFMLWDKEAKANARGGFRLSNAWKDDDIDWTPGVHNGVRYDGRLTAAHYTHLAIVPNPRYEGAVIFANADTPGGLMFNLFGKDGKKVELAKDAMLEVGGKKVLLSEVVNSLAAAEAEKAKVETTAKDGILGEKDSLEVGGKKYTLAEVANALASSEKAKADAAELARKAAEAAPKPLSASDIVAAPEFVNAVAAAVTAGLEKAKGDGFFNAVADIAKKRGQGEQGKETVKLSTQRDRLAAGAKRFGADKKAKA